MVGGATIYSTSLALGRDHRGGVALGPILGGVITSGISWRGIFLVNVPIGILATIATRKRVAESRAPVATRPTGPASSCSPPG